MTNISIVKIQFVSVIVMSSSSTKKIECRYKIGYADPAYSFPKSGGTKSSRGLAKNFYSTMTIEEIKNLQVNGVPVKQIFDDDSTMFLWIPHSLVIHLKEIWDAWGFTHFGKAFEWRKMEKSGKEFFGMGYRVRANSESCWLGIRGKPRVFAHNVRENYAESVEEIIQEHSVKPDIFRQRIVQLCGDLPRIELFARIKPQGWDVFGNDSRLQ